MPVAIPRAALITVGVLFLCLCAAHCRAQTPAVTPATAEADLFTPHLPARALDYIRTQRTLGIGSIAWDLAILSLFVFSGASARLRTKLVRRLRVPEPAGREPAPFRSLFVFYACYTLLITVCSLPFGLGALATEHRFGFSHESVGAFLSDEVRTWAIGLAITPVICGAYHLVARSPNRWWFWMWALTLPLLAAVLILQPLVIAPLYNSYTPLPEGPLRTKIVALATRAGVPRAEVFVEDTSRRTSHVNAYVTGVGPAARVVVNDTALHTLPEHELLAMIGHEMGHYVERHIWFGLLSGTLGSGLFFWLAFRIWPVLAVRLPRGKTGLRGPMDLAALPLLALLAQIAFLVQEPVANLESRVMEHRADAYGLRLTGLHRATARLMVGFAERDFTDPDPPLLLHLWFGSHPTLNERIAFALSDDVQTHIPPRAHP